MTQTKAVATLTPVKQLCKTITAMEENFKQALPPQVPSQKFIRTILTAIQQEDIAKKINEGKLDKNSLFQSCQKAAQDGLVIDGREAALVTFWNKDKGLNECQYMPMVGGIIKKVRNSGELSTITAQIVYENDLFERRLGIKEEIDHIPPKFGEDRGKPVGAYAVAHLKDGSYQLCVMDKNQIESVKKCAKTKMIWEGPFWDQQWEKTVIRRLCKRLPMSSDLERLFEHDNENYTYSPDAPEPMAYDEGMDAGAKPAPEKRETKAAAAVKAATGKKQAGPQPAAEQMAEQVEDAEFTEVNCEPPHPAEEGNTASQDGDFI